MSVSIGAGPLAAALAVVLGATLALADAARPAVPAPLDPARFVLNALLAPAIDGDALPLRWVDPRLRSLCGPDTEVRVNGEPLVAGSLVPVAAFRLDWSADGCRPFGSAGPRYDGRVRLTVFREEWGLSASVEPQGLRVSHLGREAVLTKSVGAVLPFVDAAAEAVDPAPYGSGD